jgi:hypothetical protein
MKNNQDKQQSATAELTTSKVDGIWGQWTLVNYKEDKVAPTKVRKSGVVPLTEGQPPETKKPDQQ